MTTQTHSAIWLNAYAARSCAVKTQNQFDPRIETVEWQPDESFQELFNGGDGFEAAVVDELVAASGLSAADLRLINDLPLEVQQAAAEHAVAQRIDLIIGPVLPPDSGHGRVGAVDLLIRGADRADGSPGYHPVEVKWHKLHERKTLTPAERANTSLLLARPDRPGPAAARRKWGYGFRVGTRESDLLQVAHYQRMLEAAGWSAPGAPLAALIGTDDWTPGTQITWIDLSEPLARTFSRSSGWLLRSPLERYDHEFGFRVQVAEAAQQLDGPGSPDPLLDPVVVKECAHCEWWQHCLTRLDPDDISLRIGKGALDVREVSALRAHGVRTVQQLAAADLDELEDWYLPEVAHRTSASERVRQAARRARMLVDDVAFARISTGPVKLPRYALEIDLDVETSADGRVYLWGFLISGSQDGEGQQGQTEQYRAFARFEDLDDDAETELALEALGWLRQTIRDAAGAVAVYHYSEYELHHLTRLAESGRHEVFSWLNAFAAGEEVDGARQGRFVDLLPVVKANFFGADGLGLKVVASRGAGFHWRDEDPGGLNSQLWFLEAVRGETPEIRDAARDRVLTYNEDDVVATARVRAWLRAQT